MMRYGFEEKGRYRSLVGNSVDRFLRKPRALRRVVYLDTSDAHETLFWLDRGYAPDRLHAVNRNPAHVAVITRRLRESNLPAVNTHGADFLDAVTGIDGEIDVLNFDGTSQLHDQGRRAFASLARRLGAGVLAVTVLAGRERRWSSTGISLAVRRESGGLPLFLSDSSGRPVGDGHRARVAAIGQSCMGAPDLMTDRYRCVCHISAMLWGLYQSASGQPMLWVSMKIEPHDDRLKDFVELSRGGRRRYLKDLANRMDFMLNHGLLPPCCVDVGIKDGEA